MKVEFGRDQQSEDGESEQRNLNQMGERIRDECSVEEVRLRRREEDAGDCGGAAEGCEAGSDGETECESGGFAGTSRSTAITMSAVTTTMTCGNAS